MSASFKGICIMMGEEAQDFDARDVAKTLGAATNTGNISPTQIRQSVWWQSVVRQSVAVCREAVCSSLS